LFFFFFNDTATTEIYTLSLHDALPIWLGHIAQAAVLPAFAHARRNSVLAALVSGSPKKMTRLGSRYGVRRLCRYEEADALLANGEVDALYIALPNDQHKE